MSWHYLSNQFEKATDNSFRKMLTITNDHFARLQAQQADPEVLPLLARTTPVHDAYLDGYSGWKSALGLYRSSTSIVEGLLEQLSSSLARQWDVAVMSEYDKGTPEHTALLPNGREPFQKGTIDERVSAVKTLGTTLTDYAALADLKVEVDDFHTEIKNARDGQQNREQLAGQSSTDLEQARKAIATMLYRNLGTLMDLNGEDPDNVLNFFEVSLIQSHSAAEEEEEEYSGPVGAGSTINIASDIDAGATVIITNTGDVSLTFCGAEDALMACPNDGTALLLSEGEVFEGTASDLLNDGQNFLNVSNNHPTAEGSYNVEVVTTED